MQEYIVKLERFIVGMRKHAIKSGITAERYDATLTALKNCNEAQLKRAIKRFTELHDKYHAEILRVWNLPHINEAMWDNYEWMYGDSPKLPEHKQMIVARRKFKRRYEKIMESINGTKKDKAEKQSGDETPTPVDSVSGS